MALTADDKARLALEKELAQLRKKESETQKQINEWSKKNTTYAKKKVINLKEQLEEEKELTLEGKNRLKDHTKLESLQKSFKKSLSQATAQTKELVNAEAELQSIKRLGVEDDFSEKEILEDILKQRNKMIALSSEQEMLDYDHEGAMEAINEMIGDKEGMDEGELAILEEEIKKNKAIANSLNEQSSATQLSEEAQEGILGALGTSKAAMKGLVASARQFAAAMMANPAMAIAAAVLMVITLVIKAAKHVRDVSTEFGVGYVNAGKLAFEMAKVNPVLRAAGIEVDALGKSLFDTFKTMSAVTTENMNKLGVLNLKFGVTGDTAAGLAQIVQRELGGSIGDNIDRVGEFAKAFDKAGVSAEAALSDMVENSKLLYDYMGGAVDQFAQATIAAHKLGLGLDTVASIADSLLDFETSIAETMNASLMIGRQLNFDRARGLALEGDTLGAVQDITRQLGGVAEYQKLNVLQRRALADALGVGTDELSALVRGENTVQVEQDTALVASNKNLIEALYANTAAQRGEKEQKSKADKKAERAEEIKNKKEKDKLIQKQIELAEAELLAMKQMKADMHTVAGLTNK